MGHRSSVIDSITWEPQLPRTHLRRAPWEQATILVVSMNGAVVRARTNSAIARGTRVSVGHGSTRGLVAVRRVVPASVPEMSEYAVQFLWLDPKLQTYFDDAVSTYAVDFESLMPQIEVVEKHQTLP
jgi:hypothetical protein